jgi:NTP pyrophosphatase (non-canonical NTP hydrolase)
MQKTYEEIETLIIEWAEARQIIQNATPTSQLLKAISEMGELADAHAKHDEAGIIDAIGDVLVCLINYSAIKKISVTGSLASAYEQIKDRKGYQTPEGTFVKE